MSETAERVADPRSSNVAREWSAPPECDADPAAVWREISTEVARIAAREPILEDFLRAAVLHRTGLEDALGHLLSAKLAVGDLPISALREVFDAAYADAPQVVVAGAADLLAVRERDPAAETLSDALLYFKGFHALQSYRVAHWLWCTRRRDLALYLQSRISQVFAVDIHPAARIGCGILIDHATSVVVGETAVIDDNVSILHEVTLGGTGKTTGDRHPKIGPGVLIGAGAKLLGDISVGAGAKIGAGSVVLCDVAAHCTVAGVPAVVVGDSLCEQPALEMDHRLP